MNISFFLTQNQIRQKTKDVTRRNGWKGRRLPKVGDILTGIVKGQGLKRGEKIQVLRQIQVKDVRIERLDRMISEPEYGAREVIREGFPEMTAAQFVAMYCLHNKCKPEQPVTRIEFTYID